MYIFLALIYLLNQYKLAYSQMMYPNIISIGLNKPLKTIWLLPEFYLNLCNGNMISVTCSSQNISSLINELEIQKFCNILSYSNFVFKKLKETSTETSKNCCQFNYSNQTFEKACYIDAKAFINFFTIQLLQIKSFLIKNPSGLLNDGNIKKYLPIPSGPLAFSFLIDLQDEFQVFYIILRLLPPWPGLIDFEKRITGNSIDSNVNFGADWKWEKLDIMSLSCMPAGSTNTTLGPGNKLFPSECRAKSSIKKSARGEVKIINIANIMQQSLARWIKITFWRNSDMTPAYTDQFYNIQEISIVGRCVCNGRATFCNLTSFPYVCNCTRDQGLIYADTNKCVTEDEHAWRSMDSSPQNTSFNAEKFQNTQNTAEKTGPIRVQTWLHGLNLSLVNNNFTNGSGEINFRFLWKGVGDKLYPYNPNTTNAKVEYYGNLSSYNQKIIDDYVKANSLPSNIVDLIDFTRTAGYNLEQDSGVVNYFDNPTTSTFITVNNITAPIADTLSSSQPASILPSLYNASQATFQHFDLMSYEKFKNIFSKDDSHLNNSFPPEISSKNLSSYANISRLNEYPSMGAILNEGSAMESHSNITSLYGNTTTSYSPSRTDVFRATLASHLLNNVNGLKFENITLIYNMTQLNFQSSKPGTYEPALNFSSESPTKASKIPHSPTEIISSFSHNFSTSLSWIEISKVSDNQSINASDNVNDKIPTNTRGQFGILPLSVPTLLPTSLNVSSAVPVTEAELHLNTNTKHAFHELTNIPESYFANSQFASAKFQMTSSKTFSKTEFMTAPVGFGVPFTTDQPLSQPVIPAQPENYVLSNPLISSLIGRSYNMTSNEVSSNALVNSLAFKNSKLYDCLQLFTNKNGFRNNSFDARLCFDAFLSLDFFPNPNDQTWSKRFQGPIGNQDPDFWKIILLLSALNSNRVNPSVPVFSRQSSLPTSPDALMFGVGGDVGASMDLPFYRQIWFTVALSFLAFCALVCFFLAVLRKHKYRVIEWYPAALSNSMILRGDAASSPKHKKSGLLRGSSIYGTVNGYPRSGATRYRNTSVNGVYQKKVNADVHQLYGLENPNFNYDEIIMYDFEDNNAAASSQDMPAKSFRQLYSIPETRI